MAKFEIIDHTADVGIIAYGSSAEEVFVNAAYGMFNIIAELAEVGETIQRDIVAEASDLEELLVTWLNELLYLFDAEKLIFKRFEIKNLEREKLYATAYGEKVDPSRHKLKTEVKAATYHLLKLERNDDFKAQVIFDI